jgi:hypothetical protein
MSLFDSASIVITPNGVKEGKLYSIKPSDGSGDLSVTRATTATRVNSAGLVEVVPYNLVEYSEAFDNAYWSTDSASITANTTKAPNGTLTADTFTRNLLTGYVYKGGFTLPVGQFTQSVYAKANATSSIRLELVTGSFGRGAACIFDLSNGTAGTITIYGGVSGFTATITNEGDGWYRCSISGTINISDSYFYELSITTGSVYIWGAQLNEGTLKDYQKTTTRLNIPRLDYTNGSCPSILVEPQRTNVLTYSQDFTNSAWAKSDVTITANSIISPSGILNGSKIIPNSNNTFHAFYESVPTGVYSFSIYAKAGGETTFSMWVNDFSKRAIFDLSSGTITSSNVTNSTITNVGNGWYRCTVYDTTSTSFVAVYGRNGGNFVGNGVDGIYFWGGQVEAGAYPTSYIPTTSASVTRNADVISKTGISSLIGVNQGSIYLNFDAIGINGGGGNYLFDLSDNINFDSNRIAVYWSSDNNLVLFYGYGGTYSSQSHSVNFATTKKIAVRWTSTQIQIIINGVAKTAVTYGNSSPTKLDLGHRFSNNEMLGVKIKECVLFNTTISTAQLEQLTTI